MQLVVLITRTFREDALKGTQVRRHTISPHIQSRDEVLVEVAGRGMERTIEDPRKLLQEAAVHLADASSNVDDIEPRPWGDRERNFHSVACHARASRRPEAIQQTAGQREPGPGSKKRSRR